MGGSRQSYRAIKKRNRRAREENRPRYGGEARERVDPSKRESLGKEGIEINW